MHGDIPTQNKRVDLRLGEKGCYFDLTSDILGSKEILLMIENAILYFLNSLDFFYNDCFKPTANVELRFNCRYLKGCCMAYTLS